MTNIGYQGVVTITLIKNGIPIRCVRHNTGTEFLFKYLARCIANIDVDEAYLDSHCPSGIDIKDGTNSILLNSPQALQIKTVDDASVKMRTTIPHTSFNKDLTISNNKVSIILYNKSKIEGTLGLQPLAEVSIEASLCESVRTNEGSQLLIEWSMEVLNIPDNTSGGNT